MRNLGFSTALAAAVLLAVPGCWTAPPDDAGDEAFAAWATVALLGRRPYNHDEVEALAALADAEGREAVLDVLMARPEFSTYWSRVLWEDLRLATSNMNSEFTEKPSDTSCYTTERMSSYHDAALVHHLTYEEWDVPFCPGPVITGSTSLPSQGDRTVGGLPEIAYVDEQTRTAELERLAIGTPRYTASPMETLATGGVETSALPADGWRVGRPATTSRLNPAISTCQSFTQADVMRAALAEDRLDVLYRAGLVSVAIHNTNEGVAGAKVLEAFCDRDTACLECHNTTYGVTEEQNRNDFWDRHHPASYVDLEGSAFSWEDAEGYHYGGNGAGVAEGVNAFFRTESYQASGGRQPWGMHASCVAASGRSGFATVPAAGPDPASLAGLHSSTIGPLQLVDQFALGVSVLDLESLDTELGKFPVLGGAPGNAATGAGIVAGCEAGCHAVGNGYGAPEDLELHTKYMNPAKLWDILVVSGAGAGGMAPPFRPPTGADQATIDASHANARHVIAHLTSAGVGHVNNLVHDEPAASLAHMAALTIANSVFEEVAGYSLILEHGIPRNEEASATLEHLAREFVANGWSLKVLLKRIAMSDAANRRAPANSAQPDRYELPMLFDPWADVNDATPNTAAGEDANGEGDEVHRYSVHSLLLQVHHALKWPLPAQFPSDSSSVFADGNLRRDLGAYVNYNNPGFSEVVLPALLAWEVEVAGCVNPAPLTPDYIDTLTDAGNGLTVEQAMLALKDRLISDGQWWDGQLVGSGEGPIIVIEPPPMESAIVEDSLGVDLDALASDNEPAIRDYCASLLVSPQFVLGGLAAWDAAHLPPDPDPDLPCVDALCDYDDYCEFYRDEALDLGYGELACGLTGPGGFTTR